MVRHSRLMLVLAVSAVAVSSVAGCAKAGEELQRVQRAVGNGAQGALSARPDPEEVRAAVPDAPPTNQVPVPELALDGSLRFTPDANHRNITGARGASGFVVSWTDAAQSSVFVGLLTSERRALGQGTRLHAISGDEESLAAPAVAVANDGYGVAWADRDNGRIRFARLDARGALRGSVAIVHDGVDAPRSVALGWSGHEFALAASLRDGVYFARVSTEGARVGDPLVFAEGEAVRSLDGVAWDGRAYDLTFTVRRDGRDEQLRQRVSRGDRHGGPAIVGSVDRSTPRA
jgi:hypothetical protein